MTQLALPLQLADHAVFASFLDAGNEALVATLRDIAIGADTYGCWVWGPPATGKTHLLQAACDAAGDRSIYLPLSLLATSSHEILDGLENRALICIDDIDRVAGNALWEEALFALCNQSLDSGATLVVSGAAAPRECGIRLADLQSRLARLPVFQTQPLAEDERILALQLRSRHRGLELPDEAANYLLRRSRRDMTSLYDLLDKLDREALRAKRRLTVPFVRDVLENQ
jgi:DnaA family protein